MVTSDKVERAGEVATAYQYEAIDFKNANFMSCPVSNTHVSSMSEQCLPCSPIIANRQQQSLHISAEKNAHIKQIVAYFNACEKTLL